MIRYVVTTRLKTDHNTGRQSYHSRRTGGDDSADTYFLAEASQLEPGQELILFDRKLGKQVDYRYVPTEEEHRTRDAERVRLTLEAKREHATEVLRSFAAKVNGIVSDGAADSDPTYAFRWAEKAFEASAELLVIRQIEELLKDGQTPAQVVIFCRDAALSGARTPHNSSSPCHNLIQQDLTAAYAEALNWLWRYTPEGM